MSIIPPKFMNSLDIVSKSVAVIIIHSYDPSWI